MSTTLYFSKVNINSHIYDVYKDKKKKEEILKKIYNNITDNIIYEKEIIGFDSEHNEYKSLTTYKFHSIERHDKELESTIAGKVIKRMPIFITEINEDTGEELKRPIEHSEVINFYFDVFKEIICFHTSNRFGYVEFSEVFEELINRSLKSEKDEYYFKVILWREGLNLKEIKKQLTKIGKLESLKIEIIPPNPDDELLDNLQQNGEEYLENLKRGNVTNRSIILTSKAPKGLELNSSVVEKELDSIENIHSTLTSEKATRNGYVYLGAVSKDGRTYTTEQSKPVKDKLDIKPNNLREFALACRGKVNSIIRSFL